MNIEDLIAMCKAKLTRLSQLRPSAEILGDIDQINRIDAETANTQATLNKLLTLVS